MAPLCGAHVTASNTRTKSSRLRTESWCTSTPMPNTVLIIDPRTPNVGVHALNDTPSPFIDIEEPSLPHDRRFSQGRQRQSISNLFVVIYFSCSWRTTNGVSGTSTRHKTELHLVDVYHHADGKVLLPIPTVSWLDLWAWDHDSCHALGLHLCPDVQDQILFPACWYRTAAENSICYLSCQLSSFPTSSF